MSGHGHDHGHGQGHYAVGVTMFYIQDLVSRIIYLDNTFENCY